MVCPYAGEEGVIWLDLVNPANGQNGKGPRKAISGINTPVVVFTALNSRNCRYVVWTVFMCIKRQYGTRIKKIAYVGRRVEMGRVDDILEGLRKPTWFTPADYRPPEYSDPRRHVQDAKRKISEAGRDLDVFIYEAEPLTDAAGDGVEAMECAKDDLRELLQKWQGSMEDITEGLPELSGKDLRENR